MQVLRKLMLFHYILHSFCTLVLCQLLPSYHGISLQVKYWTYSAGFGRIKHVVLWQCWWLLV
jgi:hypothetical protein